MSTHLTFRLPDELADAFKTYCSDNKMTTTKAINIAVQKLITGNGNGNAAGQTSGPTSNAITDETFVLLDSLYYFVTKYSQNTLPRIELDGKIATLLSQSKSRLAKLKGGK